MEKISNVPENLRPQRVNDWSILSGNHFEIHPNVLSGHFERVNIGTKHDIRGLSIPR